MNKETRMEVDLNEVIDLNDYDDLDTFDEEAHFRAMSQKYHLEPAEMIQDSIPQYPLEAELARYIAFTKNSYCSWLVV